MKENKTPFFGSEERSVALDEALASLPLPMRKVAQKALQEQIGQFVRECMDAAEFLHDYRDAPPKG